MSIPDAHLSPVSGDFLNATGHIHHAQVLSEQGGAMMRAVGAPALALSESQGDLLNLLLVVIGVAGMAACLLKVFIHRKDHQDR